jgi:Protein of unknown function (DUF3431)
MDFSCDFVIAKYKEDLKWLQDYDKPEYKFRNVYLYNKNEEDNAKSAADLGCILNRKDCIKINLANEGRCDHTYLYHIIHNYNNLADVTIFTKGSSDLFRERKKLPFVVKKVFQTHNTVFSVVRVDTAVGHVHESGFTMSRYRASHPKNGGLDFRSTEMKPASPRPFGLWFKKHFPDISVYNISHAGVMAISRSHIHQYPVTYYEALIKELEGHPNPEVGHYFERAWLAVFHPIPDSCIYEGGGFTQHGGRRVRRKTKRRRQKKPRL